jgi:prolyl-tRNA editing enzyme YbaK/EbsC (Cys-tRNA(Pro) deacylase)
MPPFGHRRRLPTWVDGRRVAPGLTVVAGGGARDALLELTTDDLLRVTDARAADLTEPAPREAPNPARQKETHR